MKTRRVVVLALAGALAATVVGCAARDGPRPPAAVHVGTPLAILWVRANAPGRDPACRDHEEVIQR